MLYSDIKQQLWRIAWFLNFFPLHYVAHLNSELSCVGNSVFWILVFLSRLTMKIIVLITSFIINWSMLLWWIWWCWLDCNRWTLISSSHQWETETSFGKFETAGCIERPKKFSPINIFDSAAVVSGLEKRINFGNTF